MSISLSPNMSLPIPDVGEEEGPDYASDINASLTLVDQHDHASGRGVQITPAGININAALSFNQNFATSVAGLTLVAQLSAPANDTVYVSGNDLYFVDGVGNNVRITASGAVAGTPGSISSLVSPASASYSAGSGVFIWQSNTTVPADMDNGSVYIREKVANGKYVKLNAPPALSANYELTFPSALPGAQKFATIDNSGNIAASWAVDNSTIEVSSNTIQVKDSGISTAKIADAAVTQAKLAAPNYGISSSTGSFVSTSTSIVDVTNATYTITTTGRPVEIYLVPIDTGSQVDVSATSARAAYSAEFYVVRDSTTIGRMPIGAEQQNNETGKIIYPPGVIEALDNTVTAGVHTYKLQVACSAVNTRVVVSDCKLVVKEW